MVIYLGFGSTALTFPPQQSPVLLEAPSTIRLHFHMANEDSYVGIGDTTGWLLTGDLTL